MYALAWMARRENVAGVGVPGGILADDMGLGKSLTVIALILTNFYDEQPLARPQINFKRTLDKGVLRYLPNQSRDGEERGSRCKRADEQEGGELVLKNPTIGSSLSLAKLLGGGRRKDTKQKVKSSKPKVSAIALLSGGSNGHNSGGTSKDAIAQDLEQIEESLLTDDDSPDEYDSMLDGVTKAGSLSERLGMSSELLNSCNSSQDSSVHHNDGLSDDEEYLKMTDEEREKKFRPKLNLDGAFDEDSEEEGCQGTSSEGRKRNLNGGESSKVSKAPRLQDSSLDKEDDDGDLPELDDIPPSASQVKTTPPKTSELSDDLIGAPELTPNQRKNLIIPLSKPALKGRRPGATLIVTPASLIAHWIEQIEMHVDKRYGAIIVVYYVVNI